METKQGKEYTPMSKAVKLNIEHLEFGGHTFKLEGDPIKTCTKIDVSFEAGNPVAKVKMEFYAGVNGEVDAEIESVIAKKMETSM